MRGPRLYPATPTVVTDAMALIVRHLIVVNVVNDRGINVRYRPVVVNPALIPVSTVISTSRVSKAIIDAAVETDVRTPITRVPMVISVIVAPPGWRRKRTYRRSHDPGAGNPIITGVRVAPRTRRPNVIVAWSRRLAVLGKRWRGFGSLDGLVVGRALIVILRIAGITRRRRRRIALRRRLLI